MSGKKDTLQFFAKEISETRLCDEDKLFTGMRIQRHMLLIGPRAVFEVEPPGDDPKWRYARLIGATSHDDQELILLEERSGQCLLLELKEDGWYDTHTIANLDACVRATFID